MLWHCLVHSCYRAREKYFGEGHRTLGRCSHKYQHPDHHTTAAPRGRGKAAALWARVQSQGYDDGTSQITSPPSLPASSYLQLLPWKIPGFWSASGRLAVTSLLSDFLPSSPLLLCVFFIPFFYCGVSIFVPGCELCIESVSRTPFSEVVVHGLPRAV